MAETKNGAGAEAKCSRCSDALDTAGKPRWCKKCRAKYQKEYQELRQDAAENNGFQSGCRCMQAATAAYFRQYPSAVFTGAEIAHMISKLSSAELGKSLEFTQT